jgi:hypothetical protein
MGTHRRSRPAPCATSSSLARKRASSSSRGSSASRCGRGRARLPRATRDTHLGPPSAEVSWSRSCTRGVDRETGGWGDREIGPPGVPIVCTGGGPGVLRRGLYRVYAPMSPRPGRHVSARPRVRTAGRETSGARPINAFRQRLEIRASRFDHLPPGSPPTSQAFGFITPMILGGAPPIIESAPAPQTQVDPATDQSHEPVEDVPPGYPPDAALAALRTLVLLPLLYCHDRPKTSKP